MVIIWATLFAIMVILLLIVAATWGLAFMIWEGWRLLCRYALGTDPSR